MCPQIARPEQAAEGTAVRVNDYNTLCSMPIEPDHGMAVVRTVANNLETLQKWGNGEATGNEITAMRTEFRKAIPEDADTWLLDVKTRIEGGALKHDVIYSEALCGKETYTVTIDGNTGQISAATSAKPEPAPGPK